MDQALFNDHSSGYLKRIDQGGYAFVPSPLPPHPLNFHALFIPYGEAMAAIGTLNAKIAQLPNPNLIIRPLQRREALLSSAMEGTFTTSDELALLEAGAEENARADTREVLNYVKALSNAVSLMDRLPICHRLIRETHAQLLGGLPRGRGGHKRPGEYKTEQNWIGGPDPVRARYVPPPPEETAEAMDSLEAFINRERVQDIPPLIEAALVHYQFEAIHPFADGNGRVGRILIPLLLLARGLTASPVFYPSATMEGRKDVYIDRMFDVSTRGEWLPWLRFFLEICRDTCTQSINVIDQLLEFQKTSRDKALAATRSNNVLVLLDYLFVSPVVTTPAVSELLSVTHRAARMTIASLEAIGVLEKIDGPTRPEYFGARDIMRAGT